MHLKNSEKTFLISREKRLGVGGFFLEFTFEEFFKFTLDALIGMNPLTCVPKSIVAADGLVIIEEEVERSETATIRNEVHAYLLSTNGKLWWIERFEFSTFYEFLNS